MRRRLLAYARFVPPNPKQTRDAPDSAELAEFKVQMQEFVPSNSAPSGAGMEGSQWVRSCVELPGYAKGWVPVSPLRIQPCCAL